MLLSEQTDDTLIELGYENEVDTSTVDVNM
jgi:hypothetical protein